MNPSSVNKLRNILSDNKSGSTEILLKLIKWSKDKSGNKKILNKMIDAANKELKNFSIIQMFIKDFKSILKESDNSKVLNFLNEQSEMIEKRYSNLFKASFPYLKSCKRLVTLSNSKTVVEIIKRLNEHHEVFITIAESRPQLEGRIMAKEFLKNKIKVEIVPEAILPDVVAKTDAAIIGADIVLSNGDVVNKIGSRCLAITCKYFKKPFYVLTTSDKFSRKKKYVPELKNKNEIWNYNHLLLRKTNYYFEVVEKGLIAKVICN